MDGTEQKKEKVSEKSFWKWYSLKGKFVFSFASIQ